MALPTSTVQIEFSLDAYRRWVAQETEEMRSTLFPRLTELTFSTLLPSPRTDDMKQMLDDLGVEPLVTDDLRWTYE